MNNLNCVFIVYEWRCILSPLKMSRILNLALSSIIYQHWIHVNLINELPVKLLVKIYSSKSIKTSWRKKDVFHFANKPKFLPYTECLAEIKGDD